MKRLAANVLLGLRNVGAHKLRSGLTVLGVVFGVGAVVSMIAIAGGAQRVALEQIRLLGTNSLRVVRVDLTGDAKERAAQQGSKGLRDTDGSVLRDAIPGISGLAPIRLVEEAVLRGGHEALSRVVATNDDYAQVTDRRAAGGRFLSALDLRDAKRVAVVGATVKEELFGPQDPIGHDLQIGDAWFTVVGWMDPRGAPGGPSGQIQVRDVNRDVYIPMTAAQRYLPHPDVADGVDELLIRVAREELIVPTEEIVQRELLRTHRGVEDFEIMVASELLARARGTQRVFNVVMGSIAAISLLVGGIGIMNVMLTTVTERTREIGIRRAVGASQRAILFQFLTETVVISAVGGVLGIVLGLAMGRAIHAYAGWETVASPWGLLAAFGVSGLVGVLFGLYPARRAARMNPIAALRFE